MADFTGMTVRVTLKQPPNIVLHGKVKEVVAGQTLSLVDVVFQHSGERWPHWTVQGTAIADLQVVHTNTAPASATQPATSVVPQQFPVPAPPPQIQTQFQTHQQPASAAPTPQRAPSTLVDPAILSFRPSPVQTRNAAKPPPSQQTQPIAPSTPTKSMLAKAAESLPHNSSSPFIGEAKQTKQPSAKGESLVSPQQAAGVERSSKQDVAQPQESVDIPGQEPAQTEANGKKKVRRGQKKKAGATSGEQSATQSAVPPAQVMNTDVSRHGNDMNGSVKRGKGWRNTPLLQPSPTASQDKGSVKGKSKRQQKEAEQNGWATEDATDIQDMGEFDFEANHKLFDKKSVFDQLRQDDTTADEDRLVSHNRHRPGTYGGKNLHPTENVLSPSLPPKKYGSQEIESSSDADTELNFANGRSSSRHSATRTTLKKQASRQNSQIAGESKPHPLSASVSSDRGLGVNRSAISLASRGGKTVPSNLSSPRPDRTHSPHSALSNSRRRASPAQHFSTALGSHFMLQPSSAICPTLHPAALETLETAAVSRFGLTYEAISESAARCIAETLMGMLDSPTTSSRRGSRANTLRGSIPGNLQMTSSRTLLGHTPQQPVVVILAGNHAIGARVVAAARHLVTRKCKFIISEASYESADTHDAQLATQIAITKKLQKAGMNIKRGPWKRANQYIKQLPAPPAAIIDALLAGSTYETLTSETSNAEFASKTQAEVREMIDWANRSRAPVLSVGCPSGVSGTDGSATIVEGEPLAVRPDLVLALGGPMLGLLEAVRAGERWEIKVADVGINVALRAEEAVAFGREWVAGLRFVEDETGMEEEGGL